MSVPSTSQRTERQIDRPRPLPCGFVVKNGSSTRGRFSAGIPHPVSAIEISTRRVGGAHGDHDPSAVRRGLARVGEQVEKHLFEIALAARDFRNLVRHVHVQLDGAPAHAVLQDGRRRFDGAPYLPVAAPPRRIPRKRQHPAENPAADLERLLDVLEVLREHRRGEHAAAKIRLHLLDQRQHRPERVVHVMRHAARQIGHRVLPLGGHDAGAERLGAMQVLDGDRGLRSKVLDQLGVERLELFRVAGRDLQHADQAVPRHQRRAQHRRLPERSRRRRHRRCCSRATPPARRPADRSTPASCRRGDRSRRPVPTAAAPPASSVIGIRRPIRSLFAFVQAICSATTRSDGLVLLADEQRRRMIVEGQRSDAVQDLIEEILRMDLLHDLPVDPIAHAKEPIAVDPVNGG